MLRPYSATERLLVNTTHPVAVVSTWISGCPLHSELNEGSECAMRGTVTIAAAVIILGACMGSPGGGRGGGGGGQVWAGRARGPGADAAALHQPRHARRAAGLHARGSGRRDVVRLG